MRPECPTLVTKTTVRRRSSRCSQVATISPIRLARDGLDRLLRYWAALATDDPVSAPGTRFLEVRHLQSSVMAPIDGLLEPARWAAERPPFEVRFATGGIIIAERVPPLVRRGDSASAPNSRR
jgi:hypothetical protein